MIEMPVWSLPETAGLAKVLQCEYPDNRVCQAVAVPLPEFSRV